MDVVTIKAIAQQLNAIVSYMERIDEAADEAASRMLDACHGLLPHGVPIQLDYIADLEGFPDGARVVILVAGVERVIAQTSWAVLYIIERNLNYCRGKVLEGFAAKVLRRKTRVHGRVRSVRYRFVKERA